MEVFTLQIKNHCKSITRILATAFLFSLIVSGAVFAETKDPNNHPKEAKAQSQLQGKKDQIKGDKQTFRLEDGTLKKSGIKNFAKGQVFKGNSDWIDKNQKRDSSELENIVPEIVVDEHEEESTPDAKQCKKMKKHEKNCDKMDHKEVEDDEEIRDNNKVQNEVEEAQDSHDDH